MSPADTSISINSVPLPAGRPEPLAQWWALTRRIMTAMIRLELVIAVVTPVVFTVGFYLPLRFTMQFIGRLGMSYAQYVVPIVALQAMSFTMMSSGQLAASERAGGFSARLHTMPVAAFAPPAARVSAGIFRSVVALAATVAAGYLIGFRFLGSGKDTALFCVCCIILGTLFAVIGDALGNIARNAEAVSQAVTLPTLIFGMLSSGLAPVHTFPAWIRPFVRNQPISQFAEALRSMTLGTAGMSTLWVPLMWLIGMAVLGIPTAIVASSVRK